MPKILIVDDEEAARYGIRRALETPETLIFEAASARQARAAIQAHHPQLMLADINMPGEDGIALLESLPDDSPKPVVVMITAYGTARVAVQAMKAGAYDYITKPFEIDELRLVVQRALEKAALEQENRELRRQIQVDGTFGKMLGKCGGMQHVFEIAELIAPSDVTVLIQGESGTGKELLAREIHQRSSRKKGPFVAVNCAALPDTLIESELFGHEKGAFTGAAEQRKGKFEQAHGGTIFLDEIGDMGALTQAKVLRVLEERKIERLGGSSAIPVDVRILSATHKDLPAEVSAGRFRHDLLYRLKVVAIEIPPLRDRQEDLPMLIQGFLELFCLRHKKKVHLSPAALKHLTSYGWPGNVRELRNVLEGCVALNRSGEIQVADLPAEARTGGTGAAAGPDSLEPLGGGLLELPYKDAKRQFETRYLDQKLKDYGRNISLTATKIGLHRQSLQQKLKELGIIQQRGES